MTLAPPRSGHDEGREARPLRKVRACLHCHLRKVRCNAWEVGIPCTRCKRRNQANTCVLLSTNSRSAPRAAQRPSTVTEAAKVRDNEIPPVPSTNTSADVQMTEVLPPVAESGQNNATNVAAPPLRQDPPERPIQLQDDVSWSSPPGGIQRKNDSTTSTTPIDASVREEDACVRICQEMSQTNTTVVSLPSQELNTGGHELIEFHEGINSMTILSEALGQKRPNRLTRLLILEQNAKSAHPPHHYYNCLDSVDREYLQKKGAFELPPPHVCDELIRLYFSCVYPYAPVIDQLAFLQDYKAGTQSVFLLQSIFANTVPYAPQELLKQAGYQERLLAQKDFFCRAALLYDLGCERSQLRLLQGSIMLSSLSFSYSIDKDYRYWLSNACRISTRMGLHRAYAAEGMDPRAKRLFRRIWWVLYNRDTLLATSGLDNLRRFNDRYCDTPPLTEDDWDEETDVPEVYRDFISPATTFQKLFMMEYSKLSVISGLFLRDFKTPGRCPSTAQIDALSNRITSWRMDLPPAMQIGTLQEWSSDNILILVLLALGFRLEAVLYRSAKQHYRSQNGPGAVQRAAQRQERAIFELSTIIQRASVHEVLNLCPLSFMTCACTILAMRIETALDPTVTQRKRAATKTQIYAELGYLREACEYWSSLVWSLRMFEAVVARNGLDLAVESPSEATPMEPSIPTSMNQSTNEYNPNNVGQTGTGEMWDTTTLGEVGNFNWDLTMNDEAFGLLPVSDDYDWLQTMLSPGRMDEEPSNVH